MVESIAMGRTIDAVWRVTTLGVEEGVRERDGRGACLGMRPRVVEVAEGRYCKERFDTERSMLFVESPVGVERLECPLLVWDKSAPERVTGGLIRI